jgi:hypothetical protein
MDNLTGAEENCIMEDYPKLAACRDNPKKFLRECLSIVFTGPIDAALFCSATMESVGKNILPTDNLDVIIQMRIIEYCVSRGQVDQIWEGMRMERKDQYDKFYPMWCEVVKNAKF